MPKIAIAVPRVNGIANHVLETVLKPLFEVLVGKDRCIVVPIIPDVLISYDEVTVDMVISIINVVSGGGNLLVRVITVIGLAEVINSIQVSTKKRNESFEIILCIWYTGM